MVYTAFTGLSCAKNPLNRPSVGHNIHNINCMPFQLNLSWAKKIQNYIWTSGNFMSQISVSACFTHLSFQTRSSMIPQGIPIHFGVQTQEGNCPWIQGWQDPTSTTNWNTRCISCGRTPQVAMCGPLVALLELPALSNRWFWKRDWFNHMLKNYRNTFWFFFEFHRKRSCILT